MNNGILHNVYLFYKVIPQSVRKAIKSEKSVENCRSGVPSSDGNNPVLSRTTVNLIGLCFYFSPDDAGASLLSLDHDSDKIVLS